MCGYPLDEVYALKHILLRMSIRRIRKDLFRISQAELGGIAGVTQATVSRWEAGRLVPNLLELERIRAEAKRRGVRLKPDDFFIAKPSAAPTKEGVAA